ncbi:MAG: hypothetical protein M1814_002334 [Vezdaea aestivalis]|nr:MAG: hypothetical protein M1814_002334 [Vezdaea aestivalis]
MFARSKPHKDRDKDDRDKPRKSPRLPTDEKKRRKRSKLSEDITSNLADQDDTNNSPTTHSRRRRHTSTEKQERNMDDPRASRGSLPYPNFSKAHSRESVLPSSPKSPSQKIVPADVLTPDATEVGVTDRNRSKSTEPTAVTPLPPPSPPLTSVDDVKPKFGTDAPYNASSYPGQGPESEVSKASKVSTAETAKSSSTVRTDDTAKRDPPRTDQQIPPPPPPPLLGRSSARPTPPLKVTIENGSTLSKSSISSVRPESSVDSDATSRMRGRAPMDLFPVEPDAGGMFVSPVTPTQSAFSMGSLNNPIPNIAEAFPPSMPPTPFDTMSPQPPPPPPPPFVPPSAPRVDYLLNNGGLMQPVPRTLISAAQPYPASRSNSSSHHSTPTRLTPGVTPQRSGSSDIETIFAPYHKLLDQYSIVLNKNGSLAVATGYKSVARRLLGRLENVFARDISSYTCQCIMCQEAESVVGEEERVGWGEILEWVGGRRETPPWPPFDFEALGEAQKSGSGIPQPSLRSASRVSLRTKTPLQVNIDDDVPEEYREHYIRQSAKTKKTVDKWLMAQPVEATAPPPEVDNETLTFTILTHLSPDDRTVFTALLAPPPSMPMAMHPDSRAQTPAKPPRSDLIIKAGSALQRLYRLATLPRDPETAVFLLRHRHLHNILATLSAINTSEWDILTSGRFDGFLWSGADDKEPMTSVSRGPSRGASRGPQTLPSRVASRSGIPSSLRNTGTPFQNIDEIAASRGPTPFQSPGGKPVAFDEEQEIAALAEIEREIYVGMEALEDAFEGLHRKAETVRQQIRERNAGLSSSATAQNGASAIEVVSGTPGPAGMTWAYPSVSEIDDESEAGDIPAWRGVAGVESVSELAPDDSASNISSSRYRRPKRRNERRTPAPLEEESEDDIIL